MGKFQLSIGKENFLVGAAITVVARIVSVGRKGEHTIAYICEPGGHFPRNTPTEPYFPTKITIVGETIPLGTEVTIELSVSGKPGMRQCLATRLRAGGRDYRVKN